MACALFLLVAVLLSLAPIRAQGSEPWKFRGALEFQSVLYQGRPNGPDARSEAGTLLSFSLEKGWASWGRIHISAESEIDTHHEVARTRWIDWQEHDLRRAVVRPRELYWENRIGPLDLRLGRQEIRWGRADGINPTDNLEAYDFQDPFRDRRLPPTAAKGDLYLGSTQVELVWLPFYTPSRLPLLGRRWYVQLPEEVELSGSRIPLNYAEGERSYPAVRWGHSQFGVRWNQVARGAEYSFSYFDGFNDLPYFWPRLAGASGFETGGNEVPPPVTLLLDREIHRQRILGGDFAATLGEWGIRGESALILAADSREDDYLSYVVGVDRQLGSWSAIVEFTGQWVFQEGSLPQPTSFDRGLGRAVLFHLRRELRTDESLEGEGAVRLPTGDQAWRLTYRRKLSDRWEWRLRGSLFAGYGRGFLGQYQESSHLSLHFAYRW